MSLSSQRTPAWGPGGGLGWASKKGSTTNPHLLHPWPCFLVWVLDARSLTFVLSSQTEAQVGVGL